MKKSLMPTLLAGSVMFPVTVNANEQQVIDHDDSSGVCSLALKKQTPRACRGFKILVGFCYTSALSTVIISTTCSVGNVRLNTLQSFRGDFTIQLEPLTRGVSCIMLGLQRNLKMKPFSFCIPKLNALIICVLGVAAFSFPAMANPIRDLQDEVTKRGISSEDVNRVMKDDFGFPKSAFPYYEPPNGCSNEMPGAGVKLWNGVFRNACDNHDSCYTTPGESQSTCDSQLLDEMLKICESRRESNCSTEARVMYSAVWTIGKLAYDTAQKNQDSYIKNVLSWLNGSTRMFLTDSYVDTEMSIRPGDMIRIRASGTVRFGPLAGSGNPNGTMSSRIYNYFRGFPHGCLMGRFRRQGMGKWEGWSLIGVGWDQLEEVQLSSPGILEFLVNDSDPDNNIGAFRIEVTIHSGKKQ